MFTRRLAHRAHQPWCVYTAFPTSSIDFFALARELSAEFDIFVLDFPGYGLSDKPPEPYVYSLYDDARLLVHAITEVWNLTEYRMVTHDRGSSVGMIALDMLDERASRRRARRRRHDQRQHLSSVGQPHRVSDRAARRRNRSGDGGGDDAGTVGGRAGSEHLHAAAGPGGPRDRRAGEVLRAQRRDPRAAGHDSVSARARSRRNQLA